MAGVVPIETQILAERHRSVRRRVSFSSVVTKLTVDRRSVGRICGREGCGGCPTCEEKDQLGGMTGQSYPVSARQKRKGGELLKVWPKKMGETWDRGFCECAAGCSAACDGLARHEGGRKRRRSECPCSSEGIGCWWESWVDEETGQREGWGCVCEGTCASAVPSHRYDVQEGSLERQAVLRRVNAGLCADCDSQPGDDQNSTMAVNGDGRIGHDRT